ncbi:MAG: FKBP-type peptidyl-prolyl cis-trans isomerase [Sphingomicrobium sp.]
MPASPVANPPSRRGTGKLWLALLLLVAAGVALAWFGAGSLQGETTASGLQFRTVEAGEGELIKAVDGVMIEYEGRLEDGTVFDTSEGRGPTPMIAGQVIPGFAEALTKMQKGGRYRIRIPSALGYGATPQPGSPIPPNANLEFDVHVVQVVPNAALMQQQSGPQPQQQQQQQPEQPPQEQPPQEQPPQP